MPIKSQLQKSLQKEIGDKITNVSAETVKTAYDAGISVGVQTQMGSVSYHPRDRGDEDRQDTLKINSGDGSDVIRHRIGRSTDWEAIYESNGGNLSSPDPDVDWHDEPPQPIREDLHEAGYIWNEDTANDDGLTEKELWELTEEELWETIESSSTNEAESEIASEGLLRPILFEGILEFYTRLFEKNVVDKHEYENMKMAIENEDADVIVGLLKDLGDRTWDLDEDDEDEAPELMDEDEYEDSVSQIDEAIQ